LPDRVSGISINLVLGPLSNMRRLCLVLVAGVLLSGVLASPAFASSIAVNTEVINNTSYPVSLQAVSGDESCWNNDDFGDAETVAAGSSFTYYSSIRDNNDSCADAGDNAHTHVQLWFQQPSGTWMLPVDSGQGNLLTSGPDYSQLGDIELYYHNTSNHYLYIYNADQEGPPPTDVWFPASPVLSGSSGDGMYCLSWSQSYYAKPYDLVLTVDPEQDCPTTADGPPATTAGDQAVSGAKAYVARGDRNFVHAEAADSSAVYNLLPMLQGACELFNTTTTYCSNIDNGADWNLENISTDVASFEADDPPPTTYAWGSLSPASLQMYNSTNAAGTLNYTFSYSQGEQDSSSTTNGFSVGNEITFGDILTPVNDKVTAEYDFSTTAAQQTGTQSSTSVSSSITTQPGGTTYLYGFQGTGTQLFNYTANLTFGDQTGNAEPLTSVAPGILGYSPATAHPCIGYMIGDSNVNGSAMQMAAEAQAAGDSAEDPNYDAYEQAFLSGMAGFDSSSSKCPGFPSGFSSGGGFDGSGSMNASVLAGTGVPSTSWYPDLGSIVTCAYFDQITVDPSNPDTPCTTPSDTSATDASGRRQVPGNVIKASQHPDHSRLVGKKRSVLMIGEKNDHDTLITGPGTFNIIRGAAGGETLVAKGKTDVIFGGSGNDRIRGGPGYDSIYAGAGNDTITAGTGTGEIQGGPGNDVIISGPRSHSGLFGGAGNDTFYIHGTRSVGVFGGRGNDTYHVFGKNSTRSIVELPGQGTDTLYTDHSLTMPQNIEIGIATAPHVALTGVRTTRKLIGSYSGDTLIAGSGNERLIGGRGAQNIVFARFGFDVATGGGGADRFIFTGIPFTSWRAPEPKRFSTHRITDFNPRRGDRLVFRARYFGRQLLSNKLTLLERRHPVATTRSPTFLFDPVTKLLSYDPDGTGPQSIRRIVRLANFACENSAANGLRKYRVRIARGAHCLPAAALVITK
jgi:Ca2+-binding RTX toxin-like protein